MSPRTGRPKVDNPKNYSIKIRFDEASYNELTEYSKRNNITRSDAIREGLKLLMSQEI